MGLAGRRPHRTEAKERLGDDMIIIDILETPAFLGMASPGAMW